MSNSQTPEDDTVTDPQTDPMEEGGEDAGDQTASKSYDPPAD